VGGPVEVEPLGSAVVRLNGCDHFAAGRVNVRRSKPGVDQVSAHFLDAEVLLNLEDGRQDKRPFLLEGVSLGVVRMTCPLISVRLRLPLGGDRLRDLWLLPATLGVTCLTRDVGLYVRVPEKAHATRRVTEGPRDVAVGFSNPAFDCPLGHAQERASFGEGRDARIHFLSALHGWVFRLLHGA
jgi:hypothetical protein